MAAESGSGFSSSCGVFSPGVGGIPLLSGPRYPQWKGEFSCSKNESTVGCELYEHNNECWDVDVIGQDWSSDVALFLEDWELGRVPLSCHMTVDLLPRNKGCMLG